MTLGKNPRKYLGVRPINPPNIIYADRAPTTSDVSYVKGDIWQDLTNKASYQYNGAGVWITLGGVSADVNKLTGDSGTATPASGIIDIAGGTNITTAAATDTVTINLDAAISLATSVTSPIYTTSAADLNINSAAGQDLIMQMGDAAGANKISFEDSASAEVASMDSDGAMTAVSFATGDAAAGLTISSSDIDADGTDTNIDITLTPKGTGDVIVDLGDIQNTSGDIIVTHSSAAADVTVEATNSDNTDPASRAGFEAAVGGTSAGDPYVNFLISGGQSFTMGIDNSSTNDDFVISDSGALGTTDRLVIDGSSGDIAIPNNLSLTGAAKQLQMTGGAATDFIGTATLTAGTVTVSNTNIAATDRIIAIRIDVNGSTAIGHLVYSISAATSFTITSVQTAAPAVTETNDISNIFYIIVRQL